MAEETPQQYPGHICTRRCEQRNVIRTIVSDLEVLKELFGYKDKRNGEFRAEVEKNEDNFADRLSKLETTAASSNQWLKINAAMLGLFITVVSLLLSKLLF